MAIADAVTTAPPAAPPEPPPPGHDWARLGAFVTVALGGLLGMVEVGRLIGQITKDGFQAKPDIAFAPFHSPSDLQDAVAIWGSFRDPSLLESVSFNSLWFAHLGFDVVFIVGYAYLLLTVIPGFPNWSARIWKFWAPPAAVAGQWTGFGWLRRGVVYVVVLDLVENLLALVLIPAAASSPSGQLGDAAAWVLRISSWAKWAAVAALAIGCVYALRTRGTAGRWGWLLTGLKWHRYSVVVVVLLMVMLTASGSDVLDQLPDAQRAWWESALGRKDAAMAAVAVGSVSMALIGMGRLRTEQYRRAGYAKAATPPTVYVLALGVAVLLVIGWIWGEVFGTFDVNPKRIGIALAVFAVPTLISIGIRAKFGEANVYFRSRTDNPEADEVSYVGRVGDFLAVFTLAIGCLGLVRSFTGPGLVNGQAAQLLLSLSAIVVGALIWPVASAALAGDPRWLTGIALPNPPDTTTIPVRAPVATVAVTGLGIVTSLLLLLAPRAVSGVLGLVATAVMPFAALVLTVGLVAAWLHRARPMELFRVLGLRAAPLLTLFLVIGLLSNAIAPQDPQHRVRSTTAAGASAGATPTLAKAFDTWLATPGACTITRGDVTIRPLVLVAASGGGIRAAQWTVRSMARLAQTDCGLAPVFLSSGVSGGSVGLTIVATTSDPGDPALAPGLNAPGTALHDVEALSAPDALSAGVAGLLVGDLLAGMSGIGVPPPGTPDGQPFDRAAQMETVWEEQAGGLATPFTAPDAPGRAGQLILNSTSAGGSCRVLVSTMSLGDVPDGAPSDGEAPTMTLTGNPPACDDPNVASSYQLTAARCLPPMASSTAAMLSARFPIVTPSGVVSITSSDGCTSAAGPGDDADHWTGGTDQLIDGGYAESTGLGTIVDLAPQLMDLVLAYNAGRGEADAVVVPYVVFLENGYGSDLPPARSGGVPEPSVPLSGSGAKGALAGTSALLSRAEEVYADYLPPNDSDAATAAGLGGVAVIRPASKPRVEAPLGWVLAGITQQDLNLANSDAFTLTQPDDPYSVAPLIALLCPQGQAPQCRA